MMFVVFFLVAARTCAAAQVRAQTSRSIGQQLGAEVRAVVDGTDDEEGALGAARQLASDSEVLVHPRVSSVIAEANAAASAAVEEDRLCKRQWSTQCPDGWAVIGDLCLAPVFYQGACETQRTFAGATMAEKKKFASECSAPWPCVGECDGGRDYSAVCPLGWASSGNGLCENLDTDSRNFKCGNRYAFGDSQIIERQELAVACDLRWPCQSACKQNYKATCPKGWSVVGSFYCVAPPSYAGECSFGLNASGLAELQKQRFALKCGAPFPCAGDASGGQAPPTDADDGDAVSDGAIDERTGAVGASQLRGPRSSAVADAASESLSGALDNDGDVA